LKFIFSDSYRRAQRNIRTNHFIERFRAAEQNEYSEKYREKILLGNAALARKAGLSVITIGRIEKGENCRITTKRKIVLALGLELSRLQKSLRKYFNLKCSSWRK
jgi:DNA-binding XRE family transcriptional regulator